MQSPVLTEVIRYEEDLKRKTQETDQLILENESTQIYIETVRQMITEEEMLFKHLEVEATRLTPDARNIFNQNLNRYRRKIKQHKEYLITVHGKKSLEDGSVHGYSRYEEQNRQLIQNTANMYQAEQVQRNVGHSLQRQGETLEANIQDNRELRGDLKESEGSIALIKRSILKRKLMFISLFIVFFLVVVGIIWKKVASSEGPPGQ